MSQTQWTAVDHYFSQHLMPPDPVLESALTDSDAAGLPQINVAPNQGKLLYLLAQMQGARRILEIGTLGGYSTIWLARALPTDGGQVVTLEYSLKHADVARANLTRAGLIDKVDVRVGSALESLPALQTEGIEPFDFVFIDADKPNNTPYFEWALRLTRPGSVIVMDNVVRDGAVIDADSTDPNVKGVRGFVERVAAEPRVSATAIQTVGAKGYDGLMLIRVLG
ncbi:MAG: O-methyltransferase [Anaerolineae bacterium]|jgi:predicted O-methyltransferase YrrM|nr:O-methyltransferase [Anaerolineae bacterium]